MEGQLHRSQEVGWGVVGPQVLERVCEGEGGVVSHCVDLEAVLQEVSDCVGVAQVEGAQESVLDLEFEERQQEGVGVSQFVDLLLHEKGDTHSSAFARARIWVPTVLVSLKRA